MHRWRAETRAVDISYRSIDHPDRNDRRRGRALRMLRADQTHCVICMETLREPITTLGCAHAFHAQCIASWMDLGHGCPMSCQHEVEVEVEVEDEQFVTFVEIQRRFVSQRDGNLVEPPFYEFSVFHLSEDQRDVLVSAFTGAGIPVPHIQYDQSPVHDVSRTVFTRAAEGTWSGDFHRFRFPVRQRDLDGICDSLVNVLAEFSIRWNDMGTDS